MIVYAESSAVLAWLLGETNGAKVRDLLAGAAVVFASRLTVAESERALARLEAGAALTGSDTVVLRQVLARASGHWIRCEVGDSVLRRVGQAFPIEPVRTLDAIHLATALDVAAHEPRLAVVSLDGRMRENATRLGLAVVP